MLTEFSHYLLEIHRIKDGQKKVKNDMVKKKPTKQTKQQYIFT